MASAQNLLGFCLFACASQTPFSWVWSGGLQASKSYVAQRFALLEATFFFVFSRFQKQRFGIFLFSAFFVGSKSNVSAVFWLRFRMVWAYISFFLMGSNSEVSAFFRLRFRNGLGTKPAGVLPFRMRVPNTFFLSLPWWLAGFFFSRFQKQRFGSFLAAVSQVWALFLSLFNGFQQRRFGIFPATVSQWLGHKTCWGSAFSHARPKHLFLEFGLVACRLPSLTLRKGLPCLRRLFFFVFSRFQKQRFGSFLAAVSHGLGTISLFLMGSKSDVSAFFRLRFRNGLGTQPAGVLPFRMRVPNTFFLSLVWWLAGFQVLRCAKVCLAWGNLFFCF